MKDLAVDEFESRRRALAAQLPAKHADALLVTFLPNVRYLTGYTGTSGLLLLEGSGEALFFTDPRYRIQAAAEVSCRVKVSSGPILADVVKLASARKIRRLGFEKSRIGYEQFEFLKSRLPSRCSLEPLAGLVETQRMVKSESEISLIHRSVEANSRAFEAALRTVRPGHTREADLAAEIDYRMRKLGAEKPAFDTIVASGPRSALPHAQPSQRITGKNELLLIDMGATLAGYASDMTRVVFLGSPSSRIKRVYRAVLEAQLSAIEAVRPGVTAGHVDRQARRSLKAARLDKAFIHSTGHGLGLEIHEPPRLGKKDKTRLEEGMAITIEPGVYLEGFGGVRIEDTVVVTRNGCRVLTPTPKELRDL
ncbi:MAG TPA: Xaa-Pro peptidase family protein [Bryobacteraceae bacterium]|nr:Xaa-Pro peptidase family protein [Bryobacteraceae bacterium]